MYDQNGKIRHAFAVHHLVVDKIIRDVSQKNITGHISQIGAAHSVVVPDRDGIGDAIEIRIEHKGIHHIFRHRFPVQIGILRLYALSSRKAGRKLILPGRHPKGNSTEERAAEWEAKCRPETVLHGTVRAKLSCQGLKRLHSD